MSDRLLYVFGKFPEISHTFLVDEIDWLRQRGFTIDILVNRIDPALVAQFPTLSLDMFMPIQGPENALIRRVVPTKVLATLVNNVSHRRTFKLSRVSLSAHRAIIAHFGPQALAACKLKRRLGLDAPVIGIFHGYDMSKYVNQKGIDVYKNSGIDLFVAISDRWAQDLREMGVPGERIVTNRLGINVADVESVSARRSIGRIKDAPVRLVSVGRLVEKKGFDTLISAVASVDRELPMSIQLDIIGDGEEMVRLSEMVQQMQLVDVVRLLGAMSRQDLLAHVASADLFVLASKKARDGDMEGIPIVLMEAMALRTPVIGTVHSGIPELIEDGVTGHLVPEANEHALASAISAFVRDPNSARRFCDAAYNRISKHFTLDRYGERLVRLIQDTSRA